VSHSDDWPIKFNLDSRFDFHLTPAPSDFVGFDGRQRLLGGGLAGGGAGGRCGGRLGLLLRLHLLVEEVVLVGQLQRFLADEAVGLLARRADPRRLVLHARHADAAGVDAALVQAGRRQVDVAEVASRRQPLVLAVLVRAGRPEWLNLTFACKYKARSFNILQYLKFQVELEKSIETFATRTSCKMQNFMLQSYALQLCESVNLLSQYSLFLIFL